MTNASFAPKSGMSAADIDATIDSILVNATLPEKVAMMSGKGFFEAYVADDKVWAARPYRAGGGCERLNVPALWFTDGPRNVAPGHSTAFPCTMARGASFDTDLKHRIGRAMAVEAPGSRMQSVGSGLRQSAPPSRMGSRTGNLRRRPVPSGPDGCRAGNRYPAS